MLDMYEKSERHLFAVSLTDEYLFTKFVEHNSNNVIAQNRILFFETVESLLDMVLPKSAVRCLDRFQHQVETNSSDYKKMVFPDDMTRNVHQICLTYLVADAPLDLSLDQKIVNVAAMRASLSPIPINIFDEVLDAVVMSLYEEDYHSFALKYNLDIQLANVQSLPSPNDTEPMDDSDHDLHYDDPAQYYRSDFDEDRQSLHHQTSSILAYIHDTCPSIYSDIPLSPRTEIADDEFSVGNEIWGFYEPEKPYDPLPLDFQSKRTDSMILSQLEVNRINAHSVASANVKPALLAIVKDTRSNSLTPSERSIETAGETLYSPAGSPPAERPPLPVPEELVQPRISSMSASDKSVKPAVTKSPSAHPPKKLKKVIRNSFRKYFTA
ncbi:hypothetical protein HK103_006679 [Boothiomyces macroporosus]|uniref:RGS domain-containing protein n=1 Tax=Boothiomyces macroporosus TaxID=261099 RepID=A0AAD5Y4G4_9FUNG|nr:hypothetical protein HK103_006679 [Boothiomyces macroporosus]